MADRDLNITVRVVGADQAKRDLGGVGDQTARLGAAGLAEQRIRAAFGRGDASGVERERLAFNASQRAAERDALRFGARQYRLEGDPFYASTEAQRVQDRLARQQDRERIDAQRVRDSLNRQRTREDPNLLANQARVADDRRYDVRQARLAQDPAFAAAEAGRVRAALQRQQEREESAAERDARYQNPLAGTGFARLATPLFLLHAVAQTFEGFTKGLEEVGKELLTGQKAIDAITKSTFESIPIVGRFFQGLGELGDAISGKTAEQAAGAQWLRRQEATLGTQGRVAGLELGGAQRIHALERGVDVARINREGAEAFLGSLTPARLASYRPEVEFGVANARTGDVLAARDQAEQARNDARRQVERARADFAAAPDRLGIPLLRGRVGEIRGEADTAAGALNAARLAAERNREAGPTDAQRAQNRMLFGDRGPIDQQDRLEAAVRKAEIDQQDRLNALKEKEKELAGALQALEKERAPLGKAMEEQARAELEFKRAGVEVERNKLELLDQQYERAKAGATFAGGARPGTIEATTAAARQAQAFGVESLTPRALGLLEGNPTTQEFARKLREERGRNLPEQRELEDVVGVPHFDAAKAAADEQAGVARTAAARANVDFRRDLEKGAQEGFKDLPGIIRDAIRAEVGALRAELQRQLAQAKP